MSKIIIIVSIISGLIVASIGFIICSHHAMDTLPERAESFLNENKDSLYKFVNLCFENDIDYISREKNTSKTVNYLYKVSGYYIYAINEISNDVKRELAETLILLKKNGITKIYIDEIDHQQASFTMSSFYAAYGIQYWAEPKPIEDIKKENYSDNAYYTDENWVIIDYGST